MSLPPWLVSIQTGVASAQASAVALITPLLAAVAAALAPVWDMALDVPGVAPAVEHVAPYYDATSAFLSKLEDDEISALICAALPALSVAMSLLGFFCCSWGSPQASTKIAPSGPTGGSLQSPRCLSKCERKQPSSAVPIKAGMRQAAASRPPPPAAKGRGAGSPPSGGRGAGRR